jgi:hypothetical protein
MLPTERDHASRVMMLPLSPRRIEMMPLEVRTTAARYRAPITDFAPQNPPDFDRWLSIHTKMLIDA